MTEVCIRVISSAIFALVLSGIVLSWVITVYNGTCGYLRFKVSLDALALISGPILLYAADKLRHCGSGCD
jgi:hypothetical protein